MPCTYDISLYLCLNQILCCMKRNAWILFAVAALVACTTRQPSVQQTPVEERPTTYVDPENIIYQFLEEQATFPGGADSLKVWLAEHLIYPEEAIALQIEGTVYLQFIVEKDGSLTDIKVRHSRTHPSMERAAIEAVMGMPAWNPGRQRGVVQRSMYVLPVQFVLPGND